MTNLISIPEVEYQTYFVNRTETQCDISFWEVNTDFQEIGRAVSWPRTVEFTTGCLRFRHPLLQRNIRIELTLNRLYPFYVVVLPTTEFQYPAKSLLNFIENERFDVNHCIIFISRVNIIFQKKKRRLQLHNRIQFYLGHEYHQLISTWQYSPDFL